MSSLSIRQGNTKLSWLKSSSFLTIVFTSPTWLILSKFLLASVYTDSAHSFPWFFILHFSTRSHIFVQVVNGTERTKCGGGRHAIEKQSLLSRCRSGTSPYFNFPLSLSCELMRRWSKTPRGPILTCTTLEGENLQCSIGLPWPVCLPQLLVGGLT